MPKKPTHTQHQDIPADKREELERLDYSVKRFDDKGLHDTVHHVMLKRLKAELDLIASGKIEEPKDEVNDGE